MGCARRCGRCTAARCTTFLICGMSSCRRREHHSRMGQKQLLVGEAPGSPGVLVRVRGLRCSLGGDVRDSMLRSFAQRLSQAIIVMMVVACVAFALSRYAGDSDQQPRRPRHVGGRARRLAADAGARSACLRSVRTLHRSCRRRRLRYVLQISAPGQRAYRRTSGRNLRAHFRCSAACTCDRHSGRCLYGGASNASSRAC